MTSLNLGTKIGTFTLKQLYNGEYVNIIPELEKENNYKHSNIKIVGDNVEVYGCSLMEVISTFQPAACLN